MDEVYLFKQPFVPLVEKLRELRENKTVLLQNGFPEQNNTEDILLSAAKAQKGATELVTDAAMNAISAMNAMCAMVYMMCAEKLGNK